MRIGLDISSLTYKKQVDQIVLIAGDADFVPAAKMARREGIDFILDPMWKEISDELHEHIDGLKSTCPRPGVARKIAELAEAGVSSFILSGYPHLEECDLFARYVMPSR